MGETVYIDRNANRIKAIREIIEEFQMRSKLLEQHQVRAMNRLRGKTLLRIMIVLKEEWNG
jgi:hypothetical protein